MNRIDAVKMLLEKGANIDARNMVGKTALHVAKQGGHKDTVESLLAKGADPGPPQFPVITGDYLGEKKPGIINHKKYQLLLHRWRTTCFITRRPIILP
jgi:ankyrin repeat protein